MLPRLCLLLAFASARVAAADVAFKLTDAKDAPVTDAVVSLIPLDTASPAATSTAPIELEQKGQEFARFVTAIRAGSTVRFPNRDNVQHHVYSESTPKKFQFPLYQPGKAETVVFDQPGVVTLGCNIHDWMLAYVVVLATPWFAVTPADGATTLTGVPPGRYRAEVWHPRLARLESREIVLAAGTPAAPLTFKLTLKPDRRIRRAPEAAGRGYR